MAIFIAQASLNVDFADKAKVSRSYRIFEWELFVKSQSGSILKSPWKWSPLVTHLQRRADINIRTEYIRFLADQSLLLLVIQPTEKVRFDGSIV
jgi:hypothetical protein